MKCSQLVVTRELLLNAKSRKRDHSTWAHIGNYPHGILVPLTSRIRVPTLLASLGTTIFMIKPFVTIFAPKLNRFKILSCLLTDTTVIGSIKTPRNVWACEKFHNASALVVCTSKIRSLYLPYLYLFRFRLFISEVVVCFAWPSWT